MTIDGEIINYAVGAIVTVLGLDRGLQYRRYKKEQKGSNGSGPTKVPDGLCKERMESQTEKLNLKLEVFEAKLDAQPHKIAEAVVKKINGSLKK